MTKFQKNHYNKIAGKEQFQLKSKIRPWAKLKRIVATHKVSGLELMFFWQRISKRDNYIPSERLLSFPLSVHNNDEAVHKL